MKKIMSKINVLVVLASLSLAGCVQEDDFDLPPTIYPFFRAEFDDATNNTNANYEGWTNFAEEGSWLWREKTFTENGVTNGYLEFSAFNSGAASNKVWLITPSINLDENPNEVLSFNVAQHHLDVDAPENSLQVLISTDYDGTNVLAATWEPLDATLPTMATSWYEFINSEINLSSYTGNVHIAFKFIGSGTNTMYDGAFQLDNVYVYNKK